MNLDNLKALDKDRLLDMLGLQTRRGAMDYMVPAVSLFGVGLLLGTGLGLLVAPRPGRELRQDIARRVQNAPSAVAMLPQRANEALHRVTDRLQDKATDAAHKIS